MKLKILNHKNEVAGEVELSDKVFGVQPRRDILARVVHWQLAKRRSGSHNVKGKSDVHGTTRKFVKQKGTGGARHGSKKAVQFRGGGVMFGPVNRDHGYKLQKRIRRLGLKMALSDKARAGKLIVVESLACDKMVKTKEFLARFPGMKAVLFVDSGKNEHALRAMNNIVGYDFLPQIGANVYDVMRKEQVIISIEAVKELEGRLL